jgi:hypothetical protein
MVRFIGSGLKRGLKKRLSPSARAEAIREKHPMYQYALNEYAQAVAPGTANDDGRTLIASDSDLSVEGSMKTTTSLLSNGYEELGPIALSAVPGTRSNLDDGGGLTNDSDINISTKGAKSASSFYSSADTRGKRTFRSPFETDTPFASYEEHYGEAYTGGNIKYIYPSGYASMRPRSCPWKLSILVCIVFTWLSIFIVGYCADQAADSYYAYDKNADDLLDTRWCGSRSLYLVWALSMIITGLSAAYCGVIGYIKCRDYAVANVRSQPPGVVEGKSDYYVRIEDGISPSPSEGSMAAYRPSIYQADGTPQFWGAHIYRPTQAAVAITSR